MHCFRSKYANLLTLTGSPLWSSCQYKASRAVSQSFWRAQALWAPQSAEVLIVDGSNVAYAAAADRNRWQHLGASLSGIFVDYLHFLRAASGNPRTRYIVFDKPRRFVESHKRSAVSPQYYRRRRARSAARAKARRPLSWPASLVRWLRQLLWGKHDHRLQDVARAQGFTPIESENGWEGDDSIAAICRLLSEQPGPKRMVVVATNDSDLEQLVDENTVVLKTLPWHSGGGMPLRLVTASSFEAQYGFPPKAFAFHLALTGKRDTGTHKLSVSPRIAKKLCKEIAKGDNFEKLLESSSHWPEELRPVLRSEVKKHLPEIQRNLQLTKLHPGRDALPLGFELMNADSAHGDADFPSLLHLSHRADQTKGRDESACAPPLLRPALETLVWLHPFNTGRARYLLPHVKALCSLLTRAGVKHLAWAVSVEGLPIDIALKRIPRSMAGCSLSAASVFIIIGEGDRDRNFDDFGAFPKNLNSLGCQADAQTCLRALLSFNVKPAMLSGAAKVRTKALKRSGWDVHLLHHKVLQHVLHYDPKTRPLAQRR